MDSLIRLATPEDARDLEVLELCLFDNSFNEKTLREELQFGPCWVMLGGNTPGTIEFPILGYILTRMDGDLMDITRFGVVREEQRKGIGAALLAAAIARPNKIMLTVRKNNTGAIRLYKKNGFVVVGYLDNPTSWVMVRPSTFEPT